MKTFDAPSLLPIAFSPPTAMNLDSTESSNTTVPELVRVVLTQATRLRDRGELPQHVFEAQIDRLTKEELQPRGMNLLVRELPTGTTRFLIEEQRTGSVCDMIECPPAEVAA